MGPGMTGACPPNLGRVSPTGCCPHPARDQNYRRDKSCCTGQPCPCTHRGGILAVLGLLYLLSVRGCGDKGRAARQQSFGSWTREGLG